MSSFSLRFTFNYNQQKHLLNYSPLTSDFIVLAQLTHEFALQIFCYVVLYKSLRNSYIFLSYYIMFTLCYSTVHFVCLLSYIIYYCTTIYTQKLPMYMLYLKFSDTGKFTLFCNLLNWICATHCIVKRNGRACTSHCGFLVYCSFWLSIAQSKIRQTMSANNSLGDCGQSFSNDNFKVT